MRGVLVAILLMASCTAIARPREDCDYWRRLVFPDDTSAACISSYTFAGETPSGTGRTLVESITPAGLYSVAASPGQRLSCPVALGMSVAPNSQTYHSDPVIEAQRDAMALSACQAVVDRAKAMASCNCDIVVRNGRAILPRRTFDERYALHPPAPEEPAPAQASDPPPSRSEQTALLEMLQQRVAELEAARPAPRPATPAGASNAPRQSARALVIGNSRYTSFGPLPNPHNDARAIAAKLRSFGIDVDLLLDAGRDDLIHALNEHARKAAGKDVSILYYAGHGVQVEGVNYLIPVNMRADGITAGYIKLAGVSLNATLDYLPAKTRIVFLDACRDNPASRSLVGSRSTGVAAGLAPVNAASGTLLSFATRDGATAEDGKGLNSPYTSALLRHLDTPADISLVLRQVRQTVLQMTGGRQEPWEYGSLVGEQIVLPLMARPAD